MTRSASPPSPTKTPFRTPPAPLFSHPPAIVGRWGGEEFAVLMPRTSLTQGRQLAEEIRGTVNLAKWECRASSQPVVVTTTVSVGVVQHRNGESATEMIARVLECLARAKRRGRNCVVAEA